MGAYLSVAMLLLAGFAALEPTRMSWVYIAAFMAFEFWLGRKIASAGRGIPAVGEPPYHFSEEEAGLVGRYRFYFTYPALARDTASVLAALGLTALLLVPWLMYKQAFIQAFL